MDVIPRTHAEVSGFFAGLELVEPGVVPVDRWRPAAAGAGAAAEVPVYGGVARKP
jgi:S-adenosyl methyltransferase